jgi:hypothetical protein
MMRSWRTTNNRKRPHWRMIDGEYALYARGRGVIWHPDMVWNGGVFPTPTESDEQEIG